MTTPENELGNSSLAQQNDDTCRIVIIGSDFESNDKLIDLVFLNTDDELIEKFQIYPNIYKYNVKYDSQIINVYNISFNKLNERKFFDIFSKFLEVELNNRIDNFILYDNLETFLSRIEINLFKLLTKYYLLKFDSVILSTNEHIIHDDQILEQLINAKKDQLSIYQEHNVFYDCVELREDDNLSCDKIRMSRILEKITEKRRHGIYLNSTIDDMYKENDWLNVIDMDFGIDLELELYECALFCDCTKKNKNSIKLIESRNWIYLSEKEERGYFAITFYKKVQDKTVIVISHRGTKLNKLSNLIYDFEIALQIEPDVLKKAINYENKVLDNFELKNNSIILIHIGFSLGGYLAANCATRNLYRTFVTKYAITLDAPGIKFDENRTIKNEQNIINYFVVPNLVNTCNLHAGKIYQMSSNVSPIEEFTRICFKTVLSLPKELLYLSQTHDLEFLVNLTKNYNVLRR
ncbi:unnamed protein product, partial [Brachionus calyciflorus]